MKGLRRRAGDQRGAAAVELALIAPLLVMLVFGIIQFGLAWSQKEVYVQAAREGARFAAVGCEKPAGCSAGEVSTRVTDSAVGYPITGAVTVTMLPSNTIANGCSNANTDDQVKVSWTQTFTINIPFVPNATISAPIEAVFRCEV